MRIQFLRSSCGTTSDKLFAWITGAPLYARVMISFSNGERFGLNVRTGELEFECGPYPYGWDYVEIPCNEQSLILWCEQHGHLTARKGCWLTRWYRYRRAGIEFIARALAVAGFENVPMDPTAIELFTWAGEWLRDNPCPYSENEIRKRTVEILRW